MSALPKPPINDTRWADAADPSDIVEPLEGKKDVGWEVEEHPPSQSVNWWMLKAYKFFQYLDTIEQQILSFTDDISFAKSLKGIGSALQATAANAIIARLQVGTAANAVLGLTHIATFGACNVYAGATDGTVSIIFAVNAVFGSAGTWTKVSNGAQAFALYLFGGEIIIGHMPSAQNTAWANSFVSGAGSVSGWSNFESVQQGTGTNQRSYLRGNGRWQVLSTQSSDLEDSNPPATAVVPGNSLYAKTFCKSHGFISSGSSPVINDGVNVASVTKPGSNALTITFATAMRDTNYDVTLTVEAAGAVGYSHQVTGKTTGGFTFVVFKLNPTGPVISQIDLGANTDPVGIHFQVFGRQDT